MTLGISKLYNSGVNRRTLLKSAAVLGAGSVFPHVWTGRATASDPQELVHWSWLAASDGEVWAQMIEAFNDAHKDKGVRIRMEVVPEEQYITKVLAAAATGKAPDFGWGTAGKGAQLARDEVTIPLDDLISATGLDLSDFSGTSVQAARYPKYDNKIFMVPMDLMSLQPEINLDHVREAGLDIGKPPLDEAALMEWAAALTRREGDKVTRSGIMMTGAGVQPTVTWGIVAEQMGFQRASDDLKSACVNAVGPGPVRQAQGVDARRYRPLQGLRNGAGIYLLDWPLDDQRLCSPEPALCNDALPQDRRKASYLFRDGRAGALPPVRSRSPRTDDAGRQMAL
jgi:hypothetical protein